MAVRIQLQSRYDVFPDPLIWFWSFFLSWASIAYVTLTLLVVIDLLPSSLFRSPIEHGSSTIKGLLIIRISRTWRRVKRYWTFSCAPRFRRTYLSKSTKYILVGLASIIGVLAGNKIFSWIKNKKKSIAESGANSELIEKVNKVQESIGAIGGIQRVKVEQSPLQYNNCYAVTTPTPHKTGLDSLIPTIYKNCRLVGVIDYPSDEKDDSIPAKDKKKPIVSATHILGVKSTICVINTHAIPLDRSFEIVYDTSLLDPFEPSEISKRNRKEIFPEMIEHLGNDISLINLGGIPPFRDITKHLGSGVYDPTTLKGYLSAVVS